MIKTVSIVLLLTILSTSLFAQGRFKVRQDQYIQIGYENPTNTSLTFGQVRPFNSYTAQFNNGAWAIEDYTAASGFNFWRPWPNEPASSRRVSSNFRLFLSDDGKVGINMYPLFNTTLQVNGTLQVYSVTYSSDASLKKDVEKIENALNIITKTQPVSYEFKAGMQIIKYKDVIKASEEELEMMDEQKRKMYENDALYVPTELEGKKRFGFIAQELEKIIPEVVETDSNGLKSVNYIDLIPLTFEAIKEQQEQIETLKAELQNLKVLNQYANYPKDLGIIASLYPNDPNPFDQKTTIKYNIESDFNKAELVIFDFWGDIKAKHQITSKGEATYVFSTGNLVSGKYHYSLIVNGVVVDTRIMILMK